MYFDVKGVEILMLADLQNETTFSLHEIIV